MKHGSAPGIAAASVAVIVLYTNPGLADHLRNAKDIPLLGKAIAAAAAFGDSGKKTGREAKDKSPQGGGRDIPARYRALYKKAAADSSCGLSWRTLAAIGQVESGHGANTGPSTAGALGPMQFMPATWRAYGRDGDRDGRKDVHDPDDAIPAAAGYLCTNHADRNLRGAIWHYNHSQKYVDKVMTTAERL